MTHRRLHRWLFALPCSLAFLVAGGLCEQAIPSWTSVARADEKGDLAAIKAQARALFDEAMKLASKGRYQEALPKFQESQRLDPGTGPSSTSRTASSIWTGTRARGLSTWRSRTRPTRRR